MATENNWKQLGNEAFKKGDFAAAIENYSRAIELEADDPKSLVNRSIAHASMQ
jgi:Flp pilus assembly protein TadD